MDEGVGLARRPEEMALNGGAPEAMQFPDLVGVLHSLRYHLELEGLGQADDGGDDRLVIGVLRRPSTTKRSILRASTGNRFK